MATETRNDASADWETTGDNNPTDASTAADDALQTGDAAITAADNAKIPVRIRGIGRGPGRFRRGGPAVGNRDRPDVQPA